MNEQFKEWLIKSPQIWVGNALSYSCIEWFKNQSLAVRWGIYLQFFDSVGIKVFTSIGVDSERHFYWINQIASPESFEEREGAQVAAKDRAFEILKEQQQVTQGG